MNEFKDGLNKIIRLFKPDPKNEVGISRKGINAMEILLASQFERQGYEVGENVFWLSRPLLLAGRGILLDKRRPVIVTARRPEINLPASYEGDLNCQLLVTACGIPKAYQEYIDQNRGMNVVPFLRGRKIDISKGDISREYPWAHEKGYEVMPWDLNNPENRKRMGLDSKDIIR